jgi:hypothetical protein
VVNNYCPGLCYLLYCTHVYAAIIYYMKSARLFIFWSWLYCTLFVPSCLAEYVILLHIYRNSVGLRSVSRVAISTVYTFRKDSGVTTLTCLFFGCESYAFRDFFNQ